MIKDYFKLQKPMIVNEEVLSPDYESWENRIKVINKSLGINNKDFKFKKKYKEYVDNARIYTLSKTEKKVGDITYTCFIAEVDDDAVNLFLTVVGDTEFDFIEKNYILASMQKFSLESLELPVFIKRQQHKNN